MIETYCIYEPSTKQITTLCDTQAEVLSEVKFANVFRKMLKQEPLMAGKISLTDEEFKALNRLESERMKTKFNRFAILPRMCNSCREFVWMEPYRRSDVFHFLKGGYWKENICKRCIDKYNVGVKENEHDGE